MVNDFGLSAGALTLWNKVQGIFPDARLTSGRRSASHNASIRGASPTSQHLTGDAFDFQVPGIDPKAVQATLIASGLTYGQSISEYGAGMNPRNHLSVGSKGETLTASNGTYQRIDLSADAKKLLASSAGAGRKVLTDWLGKGIGNSLADAGVATGDALTKPADAIENAAGALGITPYIKRGALGIVAILLLAAAFFSFRAGSIIDVAKRAVA